MQSHSGLKTTCNRWVWVGVRVGRTVRALDYIRDVSCLRVYQLVDNALNNLNLTLPNATLLLYPTHFTATQPILACLTLPRPPPHPPGTLDPSPGWAGKPAQTRAPMPQPLAPSSRLTHTHGRTQKPGTKWWWWCRKLSTRSHGRWSRGRKRQGRAQRPGLRPIEDLGFERQIHTSSSRFCLAADTRTNS